MLKCWPFEINLFLVMSAILNGTQDCQIQFLKKTTQNEPFVKMNLIEMHQNASYFSKTCIICLIFN